MHASSFMFLDFELNLRAEVLTNSGERVRLPSRPFKLLSLLVRRAGELVTREEIQGELWTKGSVVDFDRVVNQYIRQLRAALGDSREAPRFIETVPRRGYRFVAPVSLVVEAPPAVLAVDTGSVVSAEQPVEPNTRRVWGWQVVLASVVALVLVGVVIFGLRSVRGAAGAPAAGPAVAGGPVSAGVSAAVGGPGAAAGYAAVGGPTAVGAPAAGGPAATARPAGSAPDKLVSAEPVPVTQPPGATELVTPEAREAYIKGRYFFNLGTQESFRKSCDYFQRALDLEPTKALAYRGMADCYLALSSSAQATADEAMPKAREMALKAIRLDPSLAEAHSALGVVLMNYDWDWQAARVELQKAVQMQPQSIKNHYALSSYYRAVGEIDAALDESRAAVSLDPSSFKSYSKLGWLLINAGRYAGATEALRKCTELSPRESTCRYGLFVSLDRSGQSAQAMTELKRFMSESDDYNFTTQVTKAYNSQGPAAARRTFLELMTSVYIRNHYMPYEIAANYAELERKSLALDYLEQAYREHSNYMNHLKVDSSFDSLRGERRFQKLMREMKLTDEQLQESQAVAAR